MTYEEKYTRLINATLAPSEFSHLDHIATAYIALTKGDFFDALRTLAHSIQTLATSAGAPDKFNATITTAYLSLIAERAQSGTYADAADFIAQNPDLLARDILTSRFSKPLLASPLARAIPLLPDLA